MKRILAFLVGVVLLMGNSLLYAANDLENWHYSKEIQFQKELQYKQIFLDEEIYRHAQEDLGDIRIINQEKDFVPYYIYNRYLNEEEETYREYMAEEILDHMKKNDRYIDFKILMSENNRDVEGNQLIFDIKDNNFLKNIKVYGSYDNEKWHQIKEDYLYRTSEAEKLKVSLEGNHKYEYYRIVFLKELDNIKVEGLKLLYNQREIKYSSFIKTRSAAFEKEVDEEEKQTVILIDNQDHLKINEIKIISKDNFNRKFTIYRGTKREDEEDLYTSIGTGKIYQVKLDNFVDKQNIIDLGAYNNQYINEDLIKIVIEDYDNKPINIEGIEVTYYVDKLVFPSEVGSSYQILFGNTEVKKPVYDLVSYQQHIEELEQEEASLTGIVQLKEEEAPKKKNWFNQRMALNALLVLVSISMVVIIFKKSGFKEL